MAPRPPSAPGPRAVHDRSAGVEAMARPAIAVDSAANAVDEQLARYRSMRNFDITEEPSGQSGKTDSAQRSAFLRQKHAASHLHYDFRLGWNGVLKSWAISKGPSCVTADKRLAVQG